MPQTDNVQYVGAGENPYAAPTVKVTWKDGAKGSKPVEISAADFDPKLHKKVEEKPADESKKAAHA